MLNRVAPRHILQLRIERDTVPMMRIDVLLSLVDLELGRLEFLRGQNQLALKCIRLVQRAAQLLFVDQRQSRVRDPHPFFGEFGAGGLLRTVCLVIFARVGRRRRAGAGESGCAEERLRKGSGRESIVP